ncbi:MutS-related protein [Mucilaginibacter sp. UYCu711]|uniref:MutS-related protein n=1 Tax=Mucilaginibacter sp. UYCu711 TaxID=3156339 RepID=UPI003D1C68E6
MAQFEIDRQTIKDLDLFSEDGNSIYSFFNHVKTVGGAKKLKEMMETPSFDVQILNSRKDTIKYFHEHGVTINLVKKDVDFIEHYLALNLDPLKSNIFDSVGWKTRTLINPTSDAYVITEGINNIYKLLKILKDFNDALAIGEGSFAIVAINNMLTAFLSKKEIEKLLLTEGGKKMKYLEFSYYDTVFRKKELAALMDVLKAVYELDAYIAIGKAVSEYGFCFAQYDETTTACVDIKGLHRPGIKNAVSNDVVIDKAKNVFFLTGANMAGKSSFLKALGLAVYLAHVGFPVPAAQMRTSLFKGLITTINLSDNINNGYSHYFSEVMRVKQTAVKIAESDNLFIIFDELFRGTNVKDAFDASLATIVALSKIKASVFLISTHIVEIAAELKVIENIAFKYFNSKIADDKPIFDYKLTDGVSAETLGYFIFKNEGIIDILEQAAVKNQS